MLGSWHVQKQLNYIRYLNQVSLVLYSCEKLHENCTKEPLQKLVALKVFFLHSTETFLVTFS